jgi:polysaccharide export outer membrane protein
MLSLKKFYSLIIPVFTLWFITGCVTQKEVEYMQGSDRTPKAFDEAEVSDYRLKPNDELFIKVNSLDDPTANIFSTATGQQSSGTESLSPYSASLLSYAIDKDGYLQLPIVGNIYVKDKTTSEVSLILTDSLSHILSQPMVKVKLVNRYVSVLGYVRSPGHYPYSQEKITIFDALGLAGDMTIFANREEVSLTRNENGKNHLIKLDLTNPEILASNY